MTGKTATIETGVGPAAQAIDLDLAPYESRVVVCSSMAAYVAGPTVSSGAAKPVPESAAPAVRGPRTAPLDLSGGWKVAFDTAAQPVAMDPLTSWTEVAGMKNFSGTATYEKTLMVDRALLDERRHLYLDFGEGTPVAELERRANGMRALLESPVREAAVVYINGQRAGSVWHPPYELDITGLLRPGANALRIVVANLAINALAAQPPPDYRALIAKYGDRFRDQDMKDIQPLPAGILGPIRIVAR
jgi:hypothetical protein